MSNFSKSLVVSLASLIVFSSPVLAQTLGTVPTPDVVPTPVIVPTPQPGAVQSDYAKDVADGQQSIKNDSEGQNNQKTIDSSENDGGQEKGDSVEVKEAIEPVEAVEMPEAPEAPEGGSSESTTGSEGGKDSSVQNVNGGEQKTGGESSGRGGSNGD